MKYINIGCGERYSTKPEWTNIDITSHSKDVIACDITKNFPYQKESFDLVYHSNVFEHLEKEHAQKFLKRCFKILKKGGTLRMAVPDLENLSREYLKQLENARNGDSYSEWNYDWMVIEIIDQMTRSYSGGQMAKFLYQEPLVNKDFIIDRIGQEGEYIMDLIEEGKRNPPPPSKKRKRHKYLTRQYWKKKVLKKLLGSDYDLLELAKFRNKGEVHQWLYDSYSLTRLLKKIGFVEIKTLNATKSNIPNWNKYELDYNKKGIIKPDSFFTEAQKP